jgi:hypothetical protein
VPGSQATAVNTGLRNGGRYTDRPHRTAVDAAYSTRRPGRGYPARIAVTAADDFYPKIRILVQAVVGE